MQDSTFNWMSWIYCGSLSVICLATCVSLKWSSLSFPSSERQVLSYFPGRERGFRAEVQTHPCPLVQTEAIQWISDQSMQVFILQEWRWCSRAEHPGDLVPDAIRYLWKSSLLHRAIFNFFFKRQEDLTSRNLVSSNGKWTNLNSESTLKTVKCYFQWYTNSLHTVSQPWEF